MPHHYVEFDDVSLPIGNPSQDHSPAASASGRASAVGGNYDLYGNANGNAQPQTLSMTGTYWGEIEYLVDETGDYLVDETGDYLIEGSVAADLRSQVAALRAKVRTRAPLWRRRLDDDVRDWKEARFVRMSQPQIKEDRDFKAEITCEFETLMTNWHAADASVASASVAASSPTAVIVENSGATIEDAVITITRTSGTITALLVAAAELGVSLHWTGSLGSGDVLVIDSGAKTVRKNGADAYGDFELYTGHTARGWMPITPGNQAIVFTLTGGAATCAISYYYQVP